MTRRSKWWGKSCSECEERIGVVSLRLGEYPRGQMIGWCCARCHDAIWREARALADSGLTTDELLIETDPIVAALTIYLRAERSDAPLSGRGIKGG